MRATLERPPVRGGPREEAPAPDRAGLGAGVALLLAIAALVGASLYRGGGSGDGTLFPIGVGAVVALVLAAVAVMLGLLPRPRLGRAGAVSVTALALLCAWTGATIAWSIAPDLSWSAFNRSLVYLALLCLGAFAGAAVRRAPSLAASGLGALAAAALVWALLGKIFPSLNEDGGRIARLRVPVEYWNALALVFVLALPVALFLAADRGRPRLVRAAAVLLAYGLVLGILLTYSRGAILAGLVALAVWLALSSDRLESVVALAVAGLVAVGVFAYALRLPGVTDDGQELALRGSQGHAFGLAVLLGGLVVFALAYGWSLLESRQALAIEASRARAWAKVGALAAIAVVIVALGVRGEAVADWVGEQADDFANPPTVLLTQESERLTSLSSNNRWTWWNEAWEAFRAAPLEGTGAESFATVHRILRDDALTVTEPHSVPLQLLAETGAVGAVLGAVAALAALAGAFAAFRRLGGREQQAALALAVGVLAYVVQSLIDFDWSFLAVTAPVLVAAGILLATGRAPSRRLDRNRFVLVPAALALAAATILSLGAPWLAERRLDDVYVALDEGRAADAVEIADSARGLNPLSLAPLVARADAEIALGDVDAARGALVRAVDLQPLDPRAWYELGAFELRIGGQPAAAVRYLERAEQLDPFGSASVLLAEAREAAG